MYIYGEQYHGYYYHYAPYGGAQRKYRHTDIIMIVYVVDHMQIKRIVRSIQFNEEQKKGKKPEINFIILGQIP
uniref:Uncharacterized protein n=1 Tax=Wuchereria bancrofti TaxID=6293 RepID=A0AAF5Q3J7_WUCBA